jgi:pyridoxine 5-phosphate synthase
MVRLGVNIDHIATLRQARRSDEPDPVAAAALCELAGADGITVHLREDRRHIQDRDVELLRQTVKTKLNLEMAAAEEIVRIACALKPHDVCIVPEKRQELTTEGGLDAAGQTEHLKTIVGQLKDVGIRVSLFIDPDERQVRAAASIGADCVELHTGKYAEACKRNKNADMAGLEEYKQLVRASERALALGLVLNAGHGLDYKNVAPVTGISGMHELNIGFSIIARAVLVGLESAVREMKELL